MNNTLKSIALAAILAPLSVFSAPGEAKAYDACTPLYGGTACVTTGRYEDEAYVNLPGFGAERFFRIQCADGGYEYHSNGEWTKSQANDFVYGYCDSRGWYVHN